MDAPTSESCVSHSTHKHSGFELGFRQEKEGILRFEGRHLSIPTHARCFAGGSVDRRTFTKKTRTVAGNASENLETYRLITRFGPDCIELTEVKVEHNFHASDEVVRLSIRSIGINESPSVCGQSEMERRLRGLFQNGHDTVRYLVSLG